MNKLEQQLRDAVDEVSGPKAAEHQRFGAAAVPGWLAGILLTVVQQYGPAAVEALVSYLHSIHPTPGK